MSHPRPLVAFLALLLLASASRVIRPSEGFDHWKHRKVFPTCLVCHAGAADSTRPFFPRPASCDNCHDGEVEKTIEWSPPSPKANNLRFTHATHSRAFIEKMGGDTTQACLSCHGEKGGEWMQVTRTIPDNCLECHGVKLAHREAPDTACATCHLPLPEAVSLSRDRIAKFPKPESHDAKDFMTGGHGKRAQPVSAGTRKFAVAPSCATCHARDFCLQCHVDAPEVPVIQALALDPRSTAIEAELKAPGSHNRDRWLNIHGRESRKESATCKTCHTQESCAACHRGAVAVGQNLAMAGPGRAPGAKLEPQLPPWHAGPFRERHAQVASANQTRCNACHVRSECLDCHRPNPGAAERFHRPGFLARHPAEAAGRQKDCSECHNPAAFCANCHTQAGFRSNAGLLRGNYHDAQGAFLLNHGRAARFNLESCVTCHSESDCLACHSAQTRRFNPHGPGFDAERLRKKNPQTCAACHGRAIPTR